MRLSRRDVTARAVVELVKDVAAVSVPALNRAPNKPQQRNAYFKRRLLLEILK